MPTPLPRTVAGTIDALDRVGDAGGVVLTPDPDRYDPAALEALHLPGPFGVHAYADRAHPPVELAHVDTTAPGGEWLIADCPVRVPGGPVVLPAELEWAAPVIQAAIDAESSSPHWEDRFVYVLAAHNFVVPGDTQRGSGWHADGIQGRRIRQPYPVSTVVAWSDRTPILVADQHFDVADVDLASDWINGWFEEQLDPAAVVVPDPGKVVAFSGYAVHADVPAERAEWRSFVRVSMCNRVWDRTGNTANAALGRYWPVALRPLPADLRRHRSEPRPATDSAAMSLEEVQDHQVQAAAEIGEAAGTRSWFVPGLHTRGSSVLDTEHPDGIAIDAHPGVMSAAATDTALAAEWLTGTVRAADRPLRVFDMTSGSGVLAIAAAAAGATVAANDLSPRAVAAIVENAELNGVELHSVTCGPGFDALAGSERFDIVLACPPYLDEHPTVDRLDHNGAGRTAFVGVSAVLDALFADGRERLAPGGVIAVTFAEWADVDAYVHRAVTLGWNGTTVARRSSSDGLRHYRLDLWRPTGDRHTSRLA